MLEFTLKISNEHGLIIKVEPTDTILVGKQRAYELISKNAKTLPIYNEYLNNLTAASDLKFIVSGRSLKDHLTFLDYNLGREITCITMVMPKPTVINTAEAKKESLASLVTSQAVKSPIQTKQLPTFEVEGPINASEKSNCLVM